MRKILLNTALIGILVILSPNLLSGQTFSPEIGANNVSTSPLLTISFEPGTEIEFASNKNIYIIKSSDPTNPIRFSTGSFFGRDEELSITDNILTIDLSDYTLDEEIEYYIATDENTILINGSYWNDLYYGNPDYPYWTFSTTGGSPSWYAGYPNLSDQSPTSITLNGQTNKEGTYYYVVTDDFTPPSEAQIKAGNNQYDNPADIAGNGTMIGDTPFREEIDINSLSYGNIYFIHIVASNATDDSDIKTCSIDLIPPILNIVSPENNANDVSIYTTISLTYSEKILGREGTPLNQSNITDYIQLLNGENEVPYTFSISGNGKTITLRPNDALEDNTTFSLIFLKKFEDQSGNIQTELSSTKQFTTEDLIIWTGAGGTDWSNAQNWDDTFYPNGHNVLIPSGLSTYPTLTSDMSVNNLYIEAGASLTQSAGSLTINGTFILHSTADVNASFIPQGDTLIVNPENVMFYQKVASPTRNYNFGVPVIGTNKNNIGITNLLYEFQNSSGSYILKGADETLIPGKGYICRSDQNMIFSGTPVTWDFNQSLVRTKAGLGWNLVSNPYSATLDFTKLEMDLEEVAYSFWIWDNINEKYNTYNASSGIGIGIPNNTPDIPSHQAFWMKVLPGNSTVSIGFRTSALKDNSTSYLKSTSNTKYPTLKLESLLEGKTDETALVFSEDAINEIGDAYDTDKMFTSSKKFCQIYTLQESQSLAINGLLPSQSEVTVPLGYKIDKSGNVEIRVKDNTLPANAKVLLEDKVKDQIIDLSQEKSYQFLAENTGVINNRFVLYLSETQNIPTGVEAISEIGKDKKSAFYTNNFEIIAYIGSLNNPKYKLFDVKGRLIDNGPLKSESENRIKVSRKGMVILVVESDNEKLEFKTVF
ncbi:Ig-like domain-containing protein [Thermophagus sp. OGC60D27]|uniref:Ig-like domain-containing protein n=1 Tax=Thermophagus sp. OGC60D27 TaxID=3458415 RepID=UPI004037E78A